MLWEEVVWIREHQLLYSIEDLVVFGLCQSIEPSVVNAVVSKDPLLVGDLEEVLDELPTPLLGGQT